MSLPNILLVTVDSLRADHVFGDIAATPAIDDLAADAAIATDGIAQGPFTTFSMPSLFTSKYPSQLTNIDFVEGVQGVLVGDEPTVQRRLSVAGYRTAGIHSNPLLSEKFGFEEGFDHFYDSIDGISQRLPGRLDLLATKIERLLRPTAYISAETLTDRALRWLDSTDESPIFLWVHYMDVHGPYQPKSGLSCVKKLRAEWLWRKAVNTPEAVTAAERDRLREAYAAEVEYTDTAIGKLVAAFENESDRETLVALTADHGDEFYEHGSYSHESKLYDELVRVPLVVDPPDGTSLDQSEFPVPLLDVTPTLVDAGKGSIEGFEGNSLLGSGDNRDELATVSEAQLTPDYAGAVRTPDWKYIETGDRIELYDLQSDPGETDGRAAEEPEVCERFAERLAAHRKRCSGARSDAEVLQSGELDNRLRSLGYLE